MSDIVRYYQSLWDRRLPQMPELDLEPPTPIPSLGQPREQPVFVPEAPGIGPITLEDVGPAGPLFQDEMPSAADAGREVNPFAGRGAGTLIAEGKQKGRPKVAAAPKKKPPRRTGKSVGID